MVLLLHRLKICLLGCIVWTGWGDEIARDATMLQDDIDQIEEDDVDPATQDTEISFILDIQIEGASNAVHTKIKTLCKKLLELVRFENRAPLSLQAIHRKIDKDQKIIQKILRSYGFYEHSIQIRIVKAGEDQSKKNHKKIIIDIKTGAVFRINKITLKNKDGSTYDQLSQKQIRTLLGLSKNSPMNADQLLLGCRKLHSFFENKGFPFVEISNPEGIITLSSKELDIIYPISLGPLCCIGSVFIQTHEKITPDFVKNRVFFKKGKLYTKELINKSQKKLMESGIFDQVTITPRPLPENATNPDNSTAPVDIDVTVSEAPPRLIGIAARYSRDDGIAGKFFWEHFNVARRGHHAMVSLVGSKTKSQIETGYDIPDFLRPLQTLKLNASATREKTLAYTGKIFVLGGSLNRYFSKKFEGNLGLELEYSALRADIRSYKNSLISIPCSLFLDKSNYILDPSRGFRIEIRLTPYFGKLNTLSSMVVMSSRGCLYLPIKTNSLNLDRISLAFSMRLGSIIAKNINDIPPHKRFYAGGGGSVRGYAKQMVGPLNSESIPTGGKSIIECTCETRIRFNQDWGMSIFLDTGAVFSNNIPTLSAKKFQTSFGIGGRYFTSIGPVRFDFAVPTKRRKNTSGKFIDALFQVYLGIGQSF